MNALILVDIQNDFLPGGALAVPGGDAVVPIANELMASGRYDLVIATQDWHPANHMSFASQHPGRQVGEVIELDGLEQILWPDHCVQGTPGASFAADLDIAGIGLVIRKGEDRHIDSYSTFFDNGRRKSTGLADELRRRGVETVTLVGLAADYCVKFSALDAVHEGYAVRVIRAGVRGVDINEGDVARAFADMQAAGVVVE